MMAAAELIPIAKPAVQLAKLRYFTGHLSDSSALDDYSIKITQALIS